MKRTPETQEFVDKIQEHLFGQKASEDCCVCCKSKNIKPEDFSDALSRKEFQISHMCQECQDSVFG